VLVREVFGREEVLMVAVNAALFFAWTFGTLAIFAVSWRALRKWSDHAHGRPRY